MIIPVWFFIMREPDISVILLKVSLNAFGQILIIVFSVI